MSDELFGVLPVDKPAGMTSRDVVNRVQRLIRPIKVGHAGTLDPLAEGVLVLCLGRATRLIPFVQQQRKTYRARFLFGRQSPTDDIEGEVEEVRGGHQPSRNEVLSVMPQFIGTIPQRPPAYAAVKVAGRRAYQLARAGVPFELSPRPVHIHRLELTGYEYPEIQLYIECGSGTYIRSVGRDMAHRLGTVAVMSSLVRTSIGPFLQHSSCQFAHLNTREDVHRHLLPPQWAVSHLPSMRLKSSEVEEIRHGRAIDGDLTMASNCVAAFDLDDQLIAILTPKSGRLHGMLCFIR